MCSKLRRRGIWEKKRSSIAPYPSSLSRVPSSPGASTKAWGGTLAQAPSLAAVGVAPDLSLRRSFRGPHSSRCPFKKEEILFINKRPNLSVQPAATPAGFRVMGATSRQRTSHRLNPGKRLGGRPFLGAAPGCSRLGYEEPEESGGGT